MVRQAEGLRVRALSPKDRRAASSSPAIRPRAGRPEKSRGPLQSRPARKQLRLAAAARKDGALVGGGQDQNHECMGFGQTLENAPIRYELSVNMYVPNLLMPVEQPPLLRL